MKDVAVEDLPLDELLWGTWSTPSRRPSAPAPPQGAEVGERPLVHDYARPPQAARALALIPPVFLLETAVPQQVSNDHRSAGLVPIPASSTSNDGKSLWGSSTDANGLGVGAQSAASDRFR